MLTKKEVTESLKKIIDPEMNVDIVDLGLIYEVEIIPSRGQKLQITNNKSQINSKTKIPNSKKKKEKDIQNNNNVDVKITMTLTSIGCPFGAIFEEEVKKELLKLKGVKNVKINLVWEPVWSMDLLSEEAKEKLGFNF